jgi:hypothetical protein
MRRAFAPSAALWSVLAVARRRVASLWAGAIDGRGGAEAEGVEALRLEAAKIEHDAWQAFESRYIAEALVLSGEMGPFSRTRQIAIDSARERGAVNRADVWHKLLETPGGEMAIGCDCGPEFSEAWHCHRFTLARQILPRFGARHGVNVVYCGDVSGRR